MDKNSYIVVSYRPWHKELFYKKIVKLTGRWHLISDKKNLTFERIKKINPEFVFFLHWSWLVPEEIINNFNCVCFHETDLPYGRGGSPLQNLIIRGHKKTKISAIKMLKGLDDGPIYLKRNLLLGGRAEDIFKRSSLVALDMIREIVAKNITPKPQKGEIVVFKRRKPEESEISEFNNLVHLYDFIRMLDAPGYPKAFLKYKNFIVEFSYPEFKRSKIICKVEIKKYEQ